MKQVFQQHIQEQAAAHAQPAPVDPPRTNVPADFSNIVGKFDRPQVEAMPTEVVVEQPITLRITITGRPDISAS